MPDEASAFNRFDAGVGGGGGGGYGGKGGGGGKGPFYPTEGGGVPRPPDVSINRWLGELQTSRMQQAALKTKLARLHTGSPRHQALLQEWKVGQGVVNFIQVRIQQLLKDMSSQ